MTSEDTRKTRLAFDGELKRPEVVTGKGQFSCGEQNCPEKDNLRTWEINFAYVEHGVKKNSLVKIRKLPKTKLFL